jgi:regulator of protease activity HflC (stomatin/prohibitin superfamily)
MQALIDFIIRNLMSLWPIVRVNEWQVGMVVRAGRIQRELPPGLHWRWWFIEEVKTWPGNEVALDLDTAAVTTSDGHAIAVSANIGYRVISLRDMWRGLWNTEASLGKLALGIIATECARQEWEYLRTQRVPLETELRATLNAQMGRWGVSIERVHLTDLVIAKPHRHYMDAPLK